LLDGDFAEVLADLRSASAGEAGPQDKFWERTI
jgi:hypothetical protein